MNCEVYENLLSAHVIGVRRRDEHGAGEIVLKRRDYYRAYKQGRRKNGLCAGCPRRSIRFWYCATCRKVRREQWAATWFVNQKARRFTP